MLLTQIEVIYNITETKLQKQENKNILNTQQKIANTNPMVSERHPPFP